MVELLLLLILLFLVWLVRLGYRILSPKPCDGCPLQRACPHFIKSLKQKAVTRVHAQNVVVVNGNVSVEDSRSREGISAT